MNVTIDTVAPAAPIIASFSTDSGTVGDGITNDNTLTLTGTAEANSNGQGLRRCHAAWQCGGEWQRRLELYDGGACQRCPQPHRTATDAAGNTGVASAALSVTIDTDGAVCADHCLVLDRQRHGG